jgi:hypothetical protein
MVIDTEVSSDWTHCVIFYIHVNLPAGAFFSRFWGSLPSLPSTFKIFRPWKKSSTIKSWPTFCDQYFWKFPIWNSRDDEKCREIRMVKVNVIFNDIRLLICLTPLQVNWVMVIKVLMIIQQLSTDWQLIEDNEVGLWHTLRWLEVWWRQLKIVINHCANKSRTTFDADENFLFRSNVQWIHLGLSCYGLFGTKADQSII